MQSVNLKKPVDYFINILREYRPMSLFEDTPDNKDIILSNWTTDANGVSDVVVRSEVTANQKTEQVKFQTGTLLGMLRGVAKEYTEEGVDVGLYLIDGVLTLFIEENNHDYVTALECTGYRFDEGNLSFGTAPVGDEDVTAAGILHIEYPFVTGDIAVYVIADAPVEEESEEPSQEEEKEVAQQPVQKQHYGHQGRKNKQKHN
ncbi:hypothetical protein PQC06_gp125 [Aeromonas phage LAh10]|uniref:Uncharacterized protein n=1 Tax=Aeromonas phage LAh10 TaxID=2591025 RepID=A0A514A1K1_9CAUD|nr:hypothetical protein PQC06_gp125 [Aeromonas phage LAh10]QDH47144.1 hypothetical protein LAh10_125 [Aeromonas phage LAh10]